MPSSKLLIAALMSAFAASTPTPASSASAPTYSCPPLPAGEQVLYCCADAYLGVAGENTATGLDCALSSGGVGQQGMCTDAARGIPLCCAAIVSAATPKAADVVTDSLGWSVAHRGKSGDGMRSAETSLIRDKSAGEMLGHCCTNSEDHVEEQFMSGSSTNWGRSRGTR